MSSGKLKKYHKIWNENNPNNLKLLNDGYVIHHIDGNHFNNKIDNLQKMKQSEHIILHNNSKSLETRNKLSKSLSGDKNPMYGKKHTKEVLLKISKRSIGENNPSAKLTRKDVEWIRDILNSKEFKIKQIKRKEIANLFEIDPTVISNIKYNKTWRI